MTSTAPLPLVAFQTFGPTHLVMLAGIAAGVPVLILLARWAVRAGRERLFSRAFAALVIVTCATFQAMDLLPGRFDLHTSLPVQLCDLAWMVVAYALWTGPSGTPSARLAAALAFYWGLFLTPQAALTPWLVADFPDPKFLGFWAMHGLIIWGAAWIVFGLRQYPTWADYLRVVSVTLGWCVVAFVLNVVLGTNYGFVNRTPSTGSILDLFGPWPVYLVVATLLLTGAWALATLAVRRWTQAPA